MTLSPVRLLPLSILYIYISILLSDQSINTHIVKMSANVNGKSSQKAVVCHGAVDLRVVRLLLESGWVEG